MSPAEIKLTPAQASAVKTRGTALLVSAAAGSGKTKVLVERLISRLTDENDPCDVTDFLVITYTRAAAAELKARIADELTARMALYPDNRHLRRQATLTAAANIDTIHGFCTGLLRENAHLAGLQPDFRVADDSESSLLKAEVLEALLEARYETIDSDTGFRLLVDTLSAGRDDKRLVDVILDTHTALLSHADPQGWIKEHCQALALEGVRDASETVWGRYLMADVRGKARYWHGVLEGLLAGAVACPDFIKAYGDSLEGTLEGLDAFLEALDGRWDEARALSNVPFPRAKSLKGYEDLKAVRTRCKDALKKAAAVFEYASADLLEDMAAVRPAVTALLQLVLDFDTAYADAKRRRGVVDFADQEHLALRLLTDDKGEPTALARAVSGRFKEILVDEYQDCSAVQELIFRAVSRDGRNIFMVGDVKQSIYRFRLADPTIFLAKYKSYRDVGGEDDNAEDECEEGRRILLSTNFRSAGVILDAVNFIFKNIMSESLGDLDYTEREYLYPGRADADYGLGPVEIDILDMRGEDTEDDEDGEAPDKTALEARFVASKIQALLSSGMEIPDGRGGRRPVGPGDIAILLRSVKEKAPVYARALGDRGIPVSLPGTEGFFDAPEVSLALSFLGIIDNPRQDVPLIAVLRCPVYGFTPDELAAVRLSDRSGDMYAALVAAAGGNDRCRAFLEELHAFRDAAPDLPADRLLWHVYNKTGLLGIMGALPGGQARRDNLVRLAQLAGRCEANGYKGVFGFMRYIRQLIELGGDAGDAAEALSAGAVNIMSIHKSKGLEFPVVILADTAKRFNLKDAAKPLLVHAGLGVGMKRTDLERRIEFPTLPRLAVSKALTRETLSEELRVLYVALTRAREKLIITAAFPDAARELQKLSKMAAQPVPPQLVGGMNSMAQMLLAPVLARPEAVRFLEEAGMSDTDGDGACRDVPDTEETPLFVLKLIPRETAETAAEAMQATAADLADAPCLQQEGGETDNPPYDPALAEEIRRRLRFEYPYKAAETLPSKLTATELKGRLVDLEASEEAEARVYAKKPGYVAARPGFASQRTALTAAERGTALHLAMQYIDFARCGSQEGIEAELNRLRDACFLSKKQYEAVDARKIAAFFSSDLGRRVLGAGKLYREFKFSLLIPADDGDVGVSGMVSDDDKVLFQGVVDCCFEENGALHIIDFKSDAVTEETLGDKTRLYSEQIKAYGRAMTAITGLPVASLTLYYFGLDRAVLIP